MTQSPHFRSMKIFTAYLHVTIADKHLCLSSFLANENSYSHNKKQSLYKGNNVTVNVTSWPLFVFSCIDSNSLCSVYILIHSFDSVIISIFFKFSIPPTLL